MLCESYNMAICGLPFLPEFILSNPRAGEIMRALKNARDD
jgi:hypothetical protein